MLLVPGNHDDPALGGSVSVDGCEMSWLKTGAWQVDHLRLPHVEEGRARIKKALDAGLEAER